MELPRFRGLVRTFGSYRRLAVHEVIAHRRLVVERGVPTGRVVPALEEVEGRDPRLSRGCEAPAVEELAFEGREEALAEGVVSGRPGRMTFSYLLGPGNGKDVTRIAAPSPPAAHRGGHSPCPPAGGILPAAGQAK